ncbi:MAG: LysM peptidoglycan-binding domain-containing protein [Anaerolineales bacterium]|nr:LysM peptidoglycan-binding domain-containing protein [Anaerolineales bacterium]
MYRKPIFILLGAALSLLLLVGAIRPRDKSAWGVKPILAHVLLDSERAERLHQELGLTEAQLESILEVARLEAEQIEGLEAESLVILHDPALSHQDKVRWVVESGYNQRIAGLLAQNQRTLANRLGTQAYAGLVDWIEAQWKLESQSFSLQAGTRKGLAMLSGNAAQAYPRSFEVYATRYDAGDRKIVALPDKCLKFANGGALQCDGYAYGQAYSVAISYEGNLVVALVGESGPWNIDDNYWSGLSDPQPRRMFADLPLGVPEAQAAYFNGYNGGLDQFGRQVTSPVAIDVSRALAADLGLGPGNNKVTVSFLWTEGWDSAQSQPASQPGTVLPPPGQIAWQTATPNPDGSVIHVVQSGQTLVGIATVYGMPLAELLALNNLTMQSIIVPGQLILVKAAEPTATASPTLTATRQPSPTPTITPTRTATPIPSPSPGPLPKPAPERKIEPVLLAILVVGMISLALLAWGVLLRRK